jgi:ParB/RepB/Spo0J family partition protein
MIMSTTKEDIVELRISSIAPSPYQYREINQAVVEGIAETLEDGGIIQQPVVVRPNPNPQADIEHEWELVFGHHRLEGAELAGKVTIPAIIRVMSTEDVLRAQLVENMQRSDPSPFEEAMGMQSMIDTGLSGRALAKSLGVSPSHVGNRLRMLKLTGKARELLKQGVIGPDVAALLGSYPAPLHDEGVKLVTYTVGIVTHCVDFRTARDRIKDNLGADVSDTPWGFEEPMGNIGACSACPKLSQNDEVAFGMVPANVCLDSSCYQMKKRLHTKAQLDAAKDKGQRVMSKADVEQLGKASGEFMPVTRSMCGQHPSGPFATTWQQAIDEIKAAGRLVPEPVMVDLEDSTGLMLTADDRKAIMQELYAIQHEFDQLDKQQQATKVDADDQEEDMEPHDEDPQPPATTSIPTAAWPAQRRDETEGMSPEMVATFRHWGKLIAPAVAKRVNGRERSNADLMMICDFVADLICMSDDRDILEEALGWDPTPENPGDWLPGEDWAAWVLGKLEAATGDEKSTFIIMAVILSGYPFSASTAAAIATKRLELAQRYGVDVIALTTDGPTTEGQATATTSGKGEDDE